MQAGAKGKKLPEESRERTMKKIIGVLFRQEHVFCLAGNKTGKVYEC